MGFLIEYDFYINIYINKLKDVFNTFSFISRSMIFLTIIGAQNNQ